MLAITLSLHVGDFNLPSIEWSDGQGTILHNPEYGHGLNKVFIDIINNSNYNLEQFVSSSPYTKNVFVSTPSLINKLHTAHGMSDPLIASIPQLT